ncbi:DUF5105 domain-containing protein [Clostridium sp. AL.422]|uniref:DUF5105 domain-containing protein n=1 Tax=Clostridium TaxID=1485 RepID=UPI00293DAC9A|nr:MULTISPECIES: DUF5105 domain-containing protein [unclassified Clostridium]MDV4149923.1 DUF5105 domain-containing protein [Clostridium sp. AL.422]
MKIIKKLSLVLVLILSTVSLYGCGKQSPTDVVNEYFQNVQKGQADIGNLVVKAEESENGTEDNIDDSNMSEETQNKLLEKVKGITYKINGETIDGDSAKVNATVKGIDFNTVLGKVIQEAFSYSLAQAFSGVEMTEEESNAYYDSLLNKYLDEVTYSERTLDVELTKVDGEWKIKDDNVLLKLLLGVDENTFGGNTDENQEKAVATQEMTLNTPFTVETENGNYTITIEGARATEERNEFSEIEVKHVVILDYSYENISFGESSGDDLYIDEYAFQVLDDEGNVLSTYPVYDDNRMPKDTPVGGKCKASATFAVNSDSKNLNITFKRGSQKVAKIIVPIN